MCVFNNKTTDGALTKGNFNSSKNNFIYCTVVGKPACWASNTEFKSSSTMGIVTVREFMKAAHGTCGSHFEIAKVNRCPIMQFKSIWPVSSFSNVRVKKHCTTTFYFSGELALYMAIVYNFNLCFYHLFYMYLYDYVFVFSLFIFHYLISLYSTCMYLYLIFGIWNLVLRSWYTSLKQNKN